jgi:VWFA-related protein
MNTRTIAIQVLGLALAAGQAPLWAQSSANPAAPAPVAVPQQPSPPAAPAMHVLRVTSRMVQIAVLVQDKQGNPISGLTKDDFVLFDGKKPQPIQFFSAETTGTRPPGLQDLPVDAYTNRIENEGAVPTNLTVILLDSFNTGFLDQAYARDQVVKLLRTVQPQDRVALYALGADLRVLHEFSSDPAALVEVLRRYKGERTRDVEATDTSGNSGRNWQLEKAKEDSGIIETQALELDHSHWTAEALRLIADHVSSVPGRKNLVWVSGSFPFNLERNNLQRTPDGQKIPFATDDELVVRALANANMAIYPVDARGLIDYGPIGEHRSVTVSPDPSTFGIMQILAQRTGGRAYFNTNAIMGSIRQVIDDSRVTYQLGFYPEDIKWDGGFHNIHVKVDRPGARAQTREGFFAMAEPNVTPDQRKEIMSQTATSPMQATGIRADVRVSLQGDPEDRTLLLSVSLDPRQLDFEFSGDHWNALADAAFVGLDGKNRVVESVVRHIPYAFTPEAYEIAMKKGLSITMQLPVLQEATELRVIILDNGNGKIGSVRIPLASYFPAKTN